MEHTSRKEIIDHILKEVKKTAYAREEKMRKFLFTYYLAGMYHYVPLMILFIAEIPLFAAVLVSAMQSKDDKANEDERKQADLSELWKRLPIALPPRRWH